MTFLAHETSTTGGFSPIELYTFEYQGLFARYTSGQELLVLGGNEFAPLYIERAEITTAADNSNSSLSITVARDNPVAVFYRQRVPVDTYKVKIERIHFNDPDEEVNTIFTGVIQNVVFKDNKIAEINCSPITNMLDGLILRADHQSKCNHTIFDSYCGLAPAVYEASAVVTSVDAKGTQITVDALPLVAHTDQYVGGVLRKDGSYTTILVQSGNDLSCLLKVEGVTTGDTVYLAPGCQNSYVRCKDRYSNEDSYLGFRDLPTRNPVGSSLQGNA